MQPASIRRAQSVRPYPSVCAGAFRKGHVGDLAELGEVVVQGADVAPGDGFGIRVEMLVAECRHPRQQGVDLTRAIA